MSDEGGKRPSAAWIAVCRCGALVLPLAVAVGHVPLSPAAAHDDGAIRALGHGSTGLLHGLDGPVAALFTLLPMGTRASACATSSAVFTGLAALVLFEIARASGLGASRLGVGLSAIVSMAAGVSLPWQGEAIGVGSSAFPALAALVGIWWVAAGSGLAAHRVPLFVFVMALTATLEPLCTLGLLASGIALTAQATRPDREGLRAERARVALAIVMGLLPLALTLVARRARPELSLTVDSLAGLGFERGASVRHAWTHLPRVEWGAVVATACIVGAGLGLARKESRAPTSALLVWVLLALVAAALGVPAGSSRHAAVVLVGTGAAFLLAGRAFHFAVSWIERADIPFARASAAMVLVLLLALPARNADESLTVRDATTELASAVWAESACGSLAPGSVMLVPDLKSERRILAARVASDLRGDLLLVPMFDVRSLRAARALGKEPLLGALFRDAIVAGVPEELSLARFAEARPVVFTYEAKHDRALARHLISSGLYMRFHPEPRGRTERRLGLEEFLGPRGEIARAALSKGKDLEIVEATASLLRSRALAIAATDDKEVVSRSLDDLRHFAPDDPLIQTLVKKLLTTKGALDLRDVTP